MLHSAILIIAHVCPEATCNIFTSLVRREEQSLFWSQVTLTPSLPFAPCLQAAAIFKVLFFVPLGLNIQRSLAQRLSFPVTGHLFQTADIERDRKRSRVWKQKSSFLFWHFSLATLPPFSKVNYLQATFPTGLLCLNSRTENWFLFFFFLITSHPVIFS